MAKQVEFIDLSTEKVLARVLTASSTVYYVDLRGERARVMRARGEGLTHVSVMDNEWLYLRGVDSYRGDEGPFASPATAHALLQVGFRHRYWWHEKNLSSPPLMRFRPRFSDARWWLQRTAERIELLDGMPPEGERTRGPDEVDFSDGPHAGAGQ